MIQTQLDQTTALQRVVISGGGTGGHIFPALAIAKALQNRYPKLEILFIGAKGRMEMDRVPQAGFRIIGLDIEGLQRQKVWKNFRVLKNFILSYYQAKKIIKEFNPNVVVGVGGYASAPTLKAAQSLGIPTLIQEQNSYAGLSNKLLASKAQCICVAYPKMERFFSKEKLVVTGNPIRPELEYLHFDRFQALQHFGFSEDQLLTVLIVGGSLGAKTINQSVLLALKSWSVANIRIIWQTGKLYYNDIEDATTGYSGEIYCSPFIEHMDWAYGLADLVVSRAGASSISELCCLGKASILIPSPNVAEDHQTKNALVLNQQGAAILISDIDSPKQLKDKVLSLLQDPQKLNQLGKQARSLHQGRSVERIINELERISQSRM